MVKEKDKRIIELGMLTLMGLEDMEKSNKSILKGREKLRYIDNVNINGEKSSGTAKYSNSVLEVARINQTIPFISLIKVQNELTNEIKYFALQKERTSGSFNKDYMLAISKYGEKSTSLLTSKVGSKIEFGKKGKYVILRRIDFEPTKDLEWDGIKCKIFEKDSEFPKAIDAIRKDIILKNMNFIEQNDLTQCSSLTENLNQFFTNLEENQNEKSTIDFNFNKPVIDSAHLQNQIILSPKQEKILRLPIGGRYLITGPAGTGKTSLLVKRIAQKSVNTFLIDQEKSDKSVEDYFMNKLNTWILFSNRPETESHLSYTFQQEQVLDFNKNIFSWNTFVNKFIKLLSDEGIRFNISEDIEILEKDSSFTDYFLSQTTGKKEILSTLIKFYKSDFSERNISYLQKVLREKSSFKSFLTVCSFMDENDLFDKINDIFDNEKSKATLLLESLSDDTNNLSQTTLSQLLTDVIRNFNNDSNILQVKEINNENKSQLLNQIQKLLGGYLKILSALFQLIEMKNHYIKIIHFDLKYFQKVFINWTYSLSSENSDSISNDLFSDFIEFLLTIANDLFQVTTIDDRLKMRSSIYQYIRDNYRREVLIEEITDFQLKQLNIIKLLCYPGTSNIFITGDLLQIGSMGSILTEKALSKFIGDFRYEHLNDVYRFKPSLFKINNYLYSKLQDKENTLKNAYTKSNDQFLPIATELNGNIELTSWITSNIEIIKNEIKQKFNVGIITFYRDQVPLLKQSIDKISDIELSIFHIDDIKGREFELLFILNIDELKEDNMYVNRLYTAISRASGFLALSYSRINNNFLEELLLKFFVKSNSFNSNHKSLRADVSLNSESISENLSNEIIHDTEEKIDEKVYTCKEEDYDDGTIWELDKVKYDPAFWNWLRKYFEKIKKKSSKKDAKNLEEIISILNKVYGFCHGFSRLTNSEYEKALRVAKFAKERGFKFYVTSLKERDY
ncbi:hypothetical protein JEZ13_09715 [bacterium]|nr:hypothetical protein [bacterium]